jgi:hypothetical protein
MKKIKITPDNINDFYDKINELIDSYFESWKIKPSSLKRYLKPGSIGLRKFIDRNDLNNIMKIEKIITDVVDDRHGMEKDGVLKFESFETSFLNYTKQGNVKSGFESPDIEEDDNTSFWTHPIFENIEKSNIEYEKSICDKYRISLGHVSVIDLDKHTYEIKHSNGSLRILVLSDKDIEVIMGNFKDLILDRIYDKTIDMKDVDFKINLKSILGEKEDLLKEINIDTDHIIKVISDLLQNDDFDYNGKLNDYYFWNE